MRTLFEIIGKIGVILLVSMTLGCQNQAPSSVQFPKSLSDGSPTAESSPIAASPVATATAIPLDLQANHPNGTVLQVKEISFSPDHISLKLAITNGHDNAIQLNRNNSEMILVDNLGNQYRLAAPPQNPKIEIAQGQTLSGTFVFLGRLAPTATSLSLVTNHQYGGDQDFTNDPKITIANLPTQASAAGTGSSEPSAAPTAPLETTASPTTTPAANSSGQTSTEAKRQSLDLQASHPNGVVLQVKGIEFTDDSIALDVVVVNGHDKAINLHQAGMILRDNLGNQYNLSAPPQNPKVEVATRSRLQGKLIFLGRIAPTAISLTLISNERYGSADNQFTETPKFTISDIPVQR